VDSVDKTASDYFAIFLVLEVFGVISEFLSVVALPNERNKRAIQLSAGKGKDIATRALRNATRFTHFTFFNYRPRSWK